MLAPLAGNLPSSPIRQLARAGHTARSQARGRSALLYCARSTCPNTSVAHQPQDTMLESC